MLLLLGSRVHVTAPASPQLPLLQSPRQLDVIGRSPPESGRVRPRAVGLTEGNPHRDISPKCLVQGQKHDS